MLMHFDEQLLLFSLSVHIDIIHLLRRYINACVGWHRKGSYSKIGADVNNNNKTNWKKKQITRVTIFGDKKCVPIVSQTSVVADVRKCLYTVVIMIYGLHMAMAIVVVTAVDNILNASFLMTYYYFNFSTDFVIDVAQLYHPRVHIECTEPDDLYMVICWHIFARTRVHEFKSQDMWHIL